MLGDPPSGLLIMILATPVLPAPPLFESSSFLSPELPDTNTLDLPSFSIFSRLFMYSVFWEDIPCLEDGGPTFEETPVPPPELLPPPQPPSPPSSPPTPPPPTLFNLSITAVREGFLLRLGDLPLALGLLLLLLLPPPPPPPLPLYCDCEAAENDMVPEDEELEEEEEDDDDEEELEEEPLICFWELIPEEDFEPPEPPLPEPMGDFALEDGGVTGT